MLDELAAKIRAIERRYAGTDPRPAQAPSIPTGWAEVDELLGGGFDGGALHEWFGTQPTATNVRLPWTPPLCLMSYLAWQAFKAGGETFWTMWIGGQCFPFPRMLVRADGTDRRLLERSIFVTVPDAASRLWAMDLALRSPAIGAVFADGSGFNMAATRRLHLVARAHRTSTFAVRPSNERFALSAAQSRWLVAWQPDVADADTARPRWRIELLRCKGVSPVNGARVWTVEWDNAQCAVRLSAPLVTAAGRAKSETTTRPSTARQQSA